MREDNYKGVIVEKDGHRRLELVIDVDAPTVIETGPNVIEVIDQDNSEAVGAIEEGIAAIVSLEELAEVIAATGDAEQSIAGTTHELLVSDIHDTVEVFEGQVSNDLIPEQQMFADTETNTQAYSIAAESFKEAIKSSFEWVGKKAGELFESLRKFIQTADQTATEMEETVKTLHLKLDDLDSSPQQAAFMLNKAKRFFVKGRLPKGSELAAFLKSMNLEYVEPFKTPTSLGDGEETLSTALDFAKTYATQSRASIPDQAKLLEEANAVIGTAVAALRNANKAFVVAQPDSADFDTYTTNEHMGTRRAWVKFPRITANTVYSLKEFPGKMAAIKAGLSQDNDEGGDQMMPTFDKRDLRNILDEVARSADDVRDILQLLKSRVSNVERLQAAIGTARLALQGKNQRDNDRITGMLNNVLLGTIAFDNAVGRIRSIRVKAILKTNEAALDLVRKHIAAYEGNASAAAADKDDSTED